MFVMRNFLSLSLSLVLLVGGNETKKKRYKINELDIRFNPLAAARRNRKLFAMSTTYNMCQLLRRVVKTYDKY